MKILLRRQQEGRGLMSTTIYFMLHVRADLTPEEKAAVKKYKLGKELLYERNKVSDPDASFIGIAAHLAKRAMNLTISVNDLEVGRRIDCKDIIEMLAVETQVMEAVQMFKKILDACRNFEGEEVLEL